MEFPFLFTLRKVEIIYFILSVLDKVSQKLSQDLEEKWKGLGGDYMMKHQYLLKQLKKRKRKKGVRTGDCS